jgi:hypothetical protein
MAGRVLEHSAAGFLNDIGRVQMAAQFGAHGVVSMSQHHFFVAKE